MTAANVFQSLFETVPNVANVKRYAMAGRRPHTEVYSRGMKALAAVGGNTVGWKEKRFSRGLARLSGPESPTKAGKKPKQTPRSATLIDVKEHVDLPPAWLYLMQNPESVGDVAVDNAKAQFAEAQENLGNRLANTVEFVCTNANDAGTLNLSTVPNSELNHTITWPTNDLAAAADWDLAGTKVLSSEIPTVQDTYVKGSGVEAGRVIATKTIYGYLAQNTEIGNLIAAGDTLAARQLRDAFDQRGGPSVLKEMSGLLWDFQNAHYALDATPDTTVEFQAASEAVFLPPEALWAEAFCMGEGWEIVPAGPAFSTPGSPQSVDQLLIPIQGYWAYVEVVTNPVLIRLHAGYRFLPIQKIPNAVAHVSTKVS